MPAAVTDLPTALLTGLAAGLATLISAIPSILGAALILLLGWIITGALAGALAKALRALRINIAADRAGVTRVLQRAQVRADAAGVIAGVVKWYLRLIVILMAADAVKLTAVSTIVNQVLAFIPNLFVAVLILAAFSWLASVARNLVTASLQPTMPNAKTIGLLAYGATFGFGVIAAATQIGVATTLIDILFVGIVGGLALAFGLAFGLGGREEAARVWRDMRGAVGNVVTEGAPASGDTSGNGRPVERREPAGRI
jgi:mechanosensitive ion channel-like protein